jgi:hypothetical protein
MGWSTPWSALCMHSTCYPATAHIAFLKHLLRYVKYSKKDRLMFKSQPGPWNIETMTPLMQLHFQCDADLGGNRDNDHSQTSYLGYLAGNLIAGARLTKAASRHPQQSQRLKLSTTHSKLRSSPIMASSTRWVGNRNRPRLKRTIRLPYTTHITRNQGHSHDTQPSPPGALH